MLPVVVKATVQAGGKIPREVSEQIRDLLKLYDASEVEITVAPPKRSASANAFLWSVVYETIRVGLFEAGIAMSCQEIHEEMKRRYLPVVISETGEVLPPTTDTDSATFFYYVESIRYDEDVLALGVHIPEPARDR